MKKSTLIFSFAILLCLFSLDSFAQTAAFTISMNPATGCKPVQVHFDDQSTGATSWSWDFGDGTGNSTLSDPDYTYSIPGTYHVVLTINGGDTETHDVIVHDIPVAGFVISNDTICTGSTITVTDTSHANDGSIIFWKWDFGDGVIDSTSGNTLSHTYNFAQIYPISLRVRNTYGCDDVTPSLNLVVVDGPSAGFTISPPSSCDLNTTVSFTNTTANAGVSVYTWDFGDPSSGANNTSTQHDPTHTFAGAGQYTVTLTADIGGCRDDFTAIYYQTVLTANFTVSDDTICRFDSALFNNTTTPTATLVTWNFDDPASGAANFVVNNNNPYHTFVGPGLHNVQMIVFANGCGDTLTQQVFVPQPPNVSLSTTDDRTYCQPPAVIDFTGSSTNTIVSWFWDFGDIGSNDTAVIQNPTYTYNNYGTFSVMLIGVDNYGCRDTAVEFTYIQIIAPTVSITDLPDSGCVGETFTFHTVTTTVQGDSVDLYTWNFGDGTGPIIGTAIQSHTFTACGVYTISVTIHTRDGCTANNSVPGLIRIGEPPNADFTFQPPAMCYGDTVHFTDLSTVGNCAITGWKWDFGSFEQNPDHVFPDTGKWDVTLVTFSNGCPDTMFKPQIITIHPPKPLFDITTNCANPFSVLFTDQSHGDEWLLWDFGDGSAKDSTNNQSPTHVYPGIGTYNVNLYDTNVTWGCGYDLTQTVIITDPIARIDADTSTKCYPATFYFSGATSQTSVNFLWNFGDPTSGALNNSNLPVDTHTFHAAGDYTVKLVVYDIYGCADSTTKIIHLWGPTAGFSVNNITGCIPLPVNFTDTSDVFPANANIVSYFWDFNYQSTDTITRTIPTTSHTYSVTGFYDVYLVVTDVNGCTDTTLRNSYINATMPAPDLNTLDTFLCPGMNSLTFNPNVQTPTYTVTWNYGDGSAPETISNSASTNHDYMNNGTYLLSVTVTDANGCSATVSDSVYVYDPVASYAITSIDPHCDGIDITITGGTGAGSGYPTNWYFVLTPPFGFPKTNVGTMGSNEFHTTLNVAGVWSLLLVVSNAGVCVDTLIKDTIEVVPGPIGYFTFDPDTGCSPLDVTFHVTPISGAEYIYADFGDGFVTAHLSTTDTVFTHTYHGPNGAQWTPQVYLGFTQDGNECNMAIANVNDSLTGHSIMVSIIYSGGITVLQDTILLNEGESDTLSTVEVYDPSLTYTWTVLPSGEQLVALNPPTSAIYTASEGDEKIQLVVKDPAGCESYDTVYVILHLCEQELVIPNVFTPGDDDHNNDGKNDTYHIKDLCPIEDFKIIIFNRWGNIVYESGDYRFRWDGKDDNGKDCSEGVYYYTLHAKRKDLHGYIHLLRGKGTK
jgi:gliding motility-associated-like protein